MWDVLIVGAGPAGTATAILCAQAGLKVAIFESEAFPRHRPGETLHPGIEPLLEKLGVAQTIANANFLRHDGTWIKWDNLGHFEPFGADESGTWLGFQAWRATFDEILSLRAKALGAQIIQPCRVLRPLIKQERIIGITTAKGDYLAQFVIDAAGSKHWLAKQLGLEIQFYSPQLIAYYGYVQGDCPTRNERPALVADQNGWTWTARVQKDLYQWTRLNFNSSRLDPNWKPEEFKSLKSIQRMKATDVTWRLVNPCAGRGYCLVGDAAFVLDPSSSHGVLKAIMSGMMAAHSIMQSMNQEQSVIDAYCQWMTNWFQHDLERLTNLYSLVLSDHNSLSWSKGRGSPYNKTI